MLLAFKTRKTLRCILCEVLRLALHSLTGSPAMPFRLPLLLLLPILAANTAAQSASGTGWVSDVVQSRALGKRTVYIATPDAYEHGTRRYPVLIVLDAE